MWGYVIRGNVVIIRVWPSMIVGLHGRLAMMGMMMMVVGYIVGIDRAWFPLHTRVIPVPEIDCLVVSIWVTPS